MLTSFSTTDKLAAVKAVPLATALQALGIAVTARGFFRLRNERTPSCHILPSGVMWYDHGSQTHGDLIQLYRYMTAQGFAEAVNTLYGLFYGTCTASGTIIPHREVQTATGSAKTPIFKAKELGMPTSPALLNYASRVRGVPVEIVQDLTSAVSVSYSSPRPGTGNKPSLALGWRGVDGVTWHTRCGMSGARGKCVAGHQGISVFSFGAPYIEVYEGMFSFLSSRCLKPLEALNGDILLLNSCSNANKAIEWLGAHASSYRAAYLCLDPDPAGRQATATLTAALQALGLRTVDLTEAIPELRALPPAQDLNDLLLSRPDLRSCKSCRLCSNFAQCCIPRGQWTHTARQCAQYTKI